MRPRLKTGSEIRVRLTRAQTLAAGDVGPTAQQIHPLLFLESLADRQCAVARALRQRRRRDDILVKAVAARHPVVDKPTVVVIELELTADGAVERVGADIGQARFGPVRPSRPTATPRRIGGIIPRPSRANARRRYSGRLSCLRAGISTFFPLSIARARAIRLRVARGMITSSI